MLDDKLIAEIAADFATDADKETNGTWLPYGAFEYLIARAHKNNSAYLAAIEVALRPYQWAIERKNKAVIKKLQKAIEKAMMPAYAEHVLKGIRRPGSTESLPYDAATGMKLFEKVPGLWDWAFQQGNEEGNYTMDQLEADSGN